MGSQPPPIYPGAPPAPFTPLPQPRKPHLDPIPGIMDFGSICTFAGASGVGKTTMLMQWAVRLRDGKTINGRPTNKPPAIGIISGDRRWRAYQPLLRKVGWLDIPHYSIRDDIAYNWLGLKNTATRPMMFGQALDRLALPPGSLVIVDPLALFIAGRLVDYHEVAIGLGLLDQQIYARQLTMQGVFHIAKQSNNPNERLLRPQDRILGSMGQIGFSDTPMFLMAPEELGQPYAGLGWSPHNEPGQIFQFQRDAQGLFVPYDEAQVPLAEVLPAQSADLLALITPVGIARSELVLTGALTLGLSPKTIYRYIAQLQEHGQIEVDDDGIVRRKSPTVQ